jgi:cell division transport system ATP-binding protein
LPIVKHADARPGKAWPWMECPHPPFFHMDWGLYPLALPRRPEYQNNMSRTADGEIVQFDNVGLRYGTDREVLSDLSFVLHPGNFYFLTGASGAGKTSLLKLLFLAQRPSRGMIRLFGTDAITMPREQLPLMRRRLGVVFQEFRLVPHLSAFDNVALPLRIAGAAERDIAKPVRDMLEWVGLSERMHAVPATLSGGEQQRVAIARAVIARPAILVADEPTGNVDPDMAVKLLRLFEALNRLGTTVLVATHDVHLLQKVPDSLIMRLDKGRLADPTGALRYPPRRQSLAGGGEA